MANNTYTEACMVEKFDVIIVGAGVVGSMVARFLSRYQLDILLIDKEDRRWHGDQFSQLCCHPRRL